MIHCTIYDVTTLNPVFQDLSLGCHIFLRRLKIFFSKKFKKKKFFLSQYVVFGTPIYVDVHELAIFATLTFFIGRDVTLRHLASIHVIQNPNSCQVEIRIQNLEKCLNSCWKKLNSGWGGGG